VKFFKDFNKITNIQFGTNYVESALLEINERYDKYNFGEVDDDINSVYDALILEYEIFDQSEADLILNKFKQFEVITVGMEYGCITIYGPGQSNLYYNVHYLGDYVYMFSVIHDRYDAIISLTIIDGFESTLMIIEERLLYLNEL